MIKKHRVKKICKRSQKAILNDVTKDFQLQTIYEEKISHTNEIEIKEENQGLLNVK